MPTPKVSQANANDVPGMGSEAFAAKRTARSDTKANAVIASSQKTKDDTSTGVRVPDAESPRRE